MARPTSLNVSISDLAQMIDHSLLHPTMTDDEVLEGLEVCKKFNVAAACIKPYHILFARKHLHGSNVKICAVIGFPHGNSTTEVKKFEARRAIEEGAHEIDMVVNVGRVKSGKWEYVESEIWHVNAATTMSGKGGGKLKVIFETDYLNEAEIIQLCQICTRLRVAFVKTSTGYGFTKQPSGQYAYTGATIPHLELMRKHCGPEIKIKAAGGVRTLDDLLRVRAVGATRVGATATVQMLNEAGRRGIGVETSVVDVVWENED